MSKLKKILTVGLFLSASFFMGCDDIISSEDSISLTNVTPAHVNISLSSTETVTMDVDASEDVSSSSNFSISITNSAGASSGYLDCNIAYTTGDKGTATFTVDALSGCPKDTFTVTVTATLGTSSSSQYFTVFVTDGTEEPVFDLDTASYTLGAQDNNDYGSNVDLDAGKVYKYTEVDATAKTVIDLFYYNRSDGAYIYSPSVAVGVTTGTNATLIADVTSSVTFADIEKQSEIDALWTTHSASASAQRLPAEPNDVFIVKTIDSGEVFLVQVTSQVAGDGGTITVKAAN